MLSFQIVIAWDICFTKLTFGFAKWMSQFFSLFFFFVLAQPMDVTIFSLGKLPFRVGEGKKWPQRVGECDNSFEDFIFLYDQIALWLNFKITIFEENKKIEKEEKKLVSTREGFPFTLLGCFHGGIILCYWQNKKESHVWLFIWKKHVCKNRI